MKRRQRTPEKPMMSDSRPPSVTFQLSKNFSSKDFDNVKSNLSIAKESHFNHRYKDYLARVHEVNKAKEILKTNRESMSTDVKKRMIQHIKHKMQIVNLMEEELAMD